MSHEVTSLFARKRCTYVAVPRRVRDAYAARRGALNVTRGNRYTHASRRAQN